MFRHSMTLPSFGMRLWHKRQSERDVPTPHVKKQFRPPQLGAYGQVSWKLSESLRFPIEREAYAQH